MNIIRQINSVFYKIWVKFCTQIHNLLTKNQLPKVKPWHMHTTLSTIQPGDIILRKYNSYVDSYSATKWEYSHSGIVVDSENIVSATDKGITKMKILDFIKDTSGFMILSPNYRDNEDIERIVCEANKLIDTEYDFLFNYDLSQLYCHEFTAHVIALGGIFVPSKERKVGFLKKYIIIDEDFIKHSNIYMVYGI